MPSSQSFRKGHYHLSHTVGTLAASERYTCVKLDGISNRASSEARSRVKIPAISVRRYRQRKTVKSRKWQVVLGGANGVVIARCRLCTVHSDEKLPSRSAEKPAFQCNIDGVQLMMSLMTCRERRGLWNYAIAAQRLYLSMARGEIENFNIASHIF